MGRDLVGPGPAWVIGSLKDVTVSVASGKAKLGNIPLAAIGVLGRALGGLTLPAPGAAAPRRKGRRTK